MQIKNSFRRGLFHPDDIKTVGLMPPSPGPKTAPLPDLTHKRSRPSLNTIGPASGSTTPHHARSSSSSYAGPSSGSFGRSEARRLHSQPEFGKYAEDDDEDYDDVFGKPANGTGMFLFGLCTPNALISMYSPTFNGNTSVEQKAVQQVMGTFEYCKI